MLPAQAARPGRGPGAAGLCRRRGSGRRSGCPLRDITLHRIGLHRLSIEAVVHDVLIFCGEHDASAGEENAGEEDHQDPADPFFFHVFSPSRSGFPVFFLFHEPRKRGPESFVKAARGCGTRKNGAGFLPRAKHSDLDLPGKGREYSSRPFCRTIMFSLFVPGRFSRLSFGEMAVRNGLAFAVRSDDRPRDLFPAAVHRRRRKELF